MRGLWWGLGALAVGGFFLARSKKAEEEEAEEEEADVEEQVEEEESGVTFSASNLPPSPRAPGPQVDEPPTGRTVTARHNKPCSTGVAGEYGVWNDFDGQCVPYWNRDIEAALSSHLLEVYEEEGSDASVCDPVLVAAGTINEHYEIGQGLEGILREALARTYNIDPGKWLDLSERIRVSGGGMEDNFFITNTWQLGRNTVLALLCGQEYVT